MIVGLSDHYKTPNLGVDLLAVLRRTETSDGASLATVWFRPQCQKNLQFKVT